MLVFSKSSKKPMIKQICSFEVFEGVSDEKLEGSDVLIAPVIVEGDDDKKMIEGVETFDDVKR